MTDNLERFKGTYEYKQLKNTYDFNETAVWQIYGEDPNCDFGGHHYQPFLGNVEGKLFDVIEYAVELPNFWQWGAGGSIKKLADIKKIDSNENKRKKELREKEQELLRQLAEISSQLKD